jgi:amidase
VNTFAQSLLPLIFTQSIEHQTMTEHLAYASASELLQRMDKREVSSRDLLEMFISRIASQNPRINAVVATGYAEARQKADAADRARNRGESWGALHGLPMTLKDTFEVVGMACSAGDTKLKNHIPKTNSTVAQRLLDAGAIIFGKTNVPWQARDFQSYNRIYGATLNPWDVTKSPGGSSGGSAAALAAGLTAVEVGSDLSGSIRIPSHYCGVCGHKPTFGAVPLHGHIPGPPLTVSGHDLWVAGPLGRSVDDLELVMGVVAESGWLEKARARRKKIFVPPHSDSQSITPGHSLHGLRVLFWVEDPICEIETHMKGAFQDLALQLRNLGVQVTFGGPEGCSLHEICACFLNQLGSVLEMGAPAFYRKGLYFLSPLYKFLQPFIRLPKFFEHYTRGAGQSYASWWRHFEIRQSLRANFLRVFSEYDVIIAPVAPNLAVEHQTVLPMSLRSMAVNGKKRPYTDQMMWVSVASLFGLPSTAVPLGISSMGLPFGLQVMGAPLDDFITMGLAREIERLTGGFRRPPEA